MKTISWGIVQIPLVKYYRACFCCKLQLVKAVAATGWKLVVSERTSFCFVHCLSYYIFESYSGKYLGSKNGSLIFLVHNPWHQLI